MDSDKTTLSVQFQYRSTPSSKSSETENLFCFKGQIYKIVIVPRLRKLNLLIIVNGALYSHLMILFHSKLDTN